MKYLVAGGAGFLGSHLCDKLIANKDEVVCMDNLSTGCESNIEHLLDNSRFQILHWNISSSLERIEVDKIYNLASPAAPDDYNKDPQETLKTNTVGVQNLLNLAKKLNCSIFQASTVRVLDSNSNGNSYINGKREAEKILSSYSKSKIGRLNSTFGPRMRSDDSRVIPAFKAKAIVGEDLVVYENRRDKFCYVDDMINEIVGFMNSEEYGTKELGHPFQIFILDLAKIVTTITNSKSKIILRGN